MSDQTYLSSRCGNRWTINELLALQREFELLGWDIDQIAEKHQRTANAIMFKLDHEGLADYNILYSNYHNLNVKMDVKPASKYAVFDFVSNDDEDEDEDNDDDVNDEDYDYNADDADDDDDDDADADDAHLAKTAM